jgi:DNA-binding HxlR family transcriptional regulator
MNTNENPVASCSATQLDVALDVLSGRWKALILYHLFSHDVLRFSDLRRALQGVSHKMLAQQLREMERDDIVQRRVYAEVPPKVEYRLSDSGAQLLPVLQALQKWAASRDGINR